MSTIQKIEEEIYKMNEKELLDYLISEKLIKKELHCFECGVSMSLVIFNRSIDKYSWRCMKKCCKSYKRYTSIRKESFFDNFNIRLKDILIIILKYSCKQQRHQIVLGVDVTYNTIKKVLNRLTNLMPETDFKNNKLVGPGVLIQVDETMLNFKVRSHRGRSPRNKTDSLCIVEVKDKITRAYAIIIPNKKQETLVPIICDQVASNSIIWTDEHKSYSKLRNYNFVHGTVCHKYQFIDKGTNVNTQAVESFNNLIKLEIKKRKGVKTEDRESFLKEFLFLFNNKSNLLFSIFNLIKVS
ncbi:hypothetical protein H312_01802 [Anncaliia algerae PRA339]|uniref:ISXO2-like transposase domain-containing protein n=1 Tax=Anncaliia algerae PRA339 TaxID=1288291 RepID=A0A059F0U3_9MICR|nr:hypothetical protein H312_01802 [Anncaliia algerae PRA339]